MALAGRPHVTRAPQGPAYLRPLNQRQINNLANKQTAAAYAAAKAPILSEQALTDARAKAAQDALAGFGQAAAKLYTSPSDVAKIYQDAASQTAGIAGAFTGEAGKQLTAAEQANADFMAKQAPGATPQNEPDPKAAADAGYYLGGYVPGAQLEGQGAAAASTQAGLPLLQAAKTEQDIMGSQAKNVQDDQQYVQAMLDLAAKEPDMRNQILDHLYQREQQKFSMRIQQQAQDLYQAKFGVQAQQGQERINQEQQRLRMEERQGNARLSLQAAGLKLSQAKYRLDVKKALINGQRIDSSASKTAGHLIDQNGQPILGKDGKTIPVAPTASGGSSGTNNGVGSTGYHEAVRATKSIMPQPKDASQASLGQYKYYAQPGKGTFVQGSGWFTNDPTQAATEGKYTFPEAVQYMMSAYGLNRRAARQALVAGGWKPNGKRPPKKTSKS